MTRHVVTSNDAATIAAAIKTLFERYVGSIVVTDDGGRCKGIFTERDAIRIVARNVSQDIPLERVMTKNPITIREGVPYAEAMDLMVTHGIRHLPVVNDDEQLVGMINIRNFMDEVVGFTRTKVQIITYSRATLDFVWKHPDKVSQILDELRERKEDLYKFQEMLESPDTPS